MSDINYPGDRPLNSATDSVTVTGSVTSSGVAAIDQTVPGVTNGVQVNAPLPVGSNIIGAVAIDQTTPGTTNGVEIVAALPAGSNVIGSVDQNGTWTVDAVQSGTWTVDATQSGTWAVDQSGSWSVDAVQSGTWTVDATQSGTWDINDITGSISLPTGAATEAKQPALGTAGTASADVITVQGIAGMTALLVDGSGSTQPVSGTVTVTQATAANLNATVTGTVAATQSGTWNINNITGSVSLPTGAAIASKQPSLGTAGTPSADVITVQGISGGEPLIVSVTGSTTPASVGYVSRLLYRQNYSSANLTTSAYTQVTASTTGTIYKLYIADTSGSAIILATGGAGSEIDRLYIGPGGNDAPYELTIASGTRVSIKALDVNATSGQIIITGLGI